MSHEMGTFRIDVEIENPARPGERRLVRSALVDSGAELSWFPRDVLQSLAIEPLKMWHFRQADGSVLRRWTGGVVLQAAGRGTIDEVVLGEPGDLILLGSRSLTGLNLRIDPVSKRLVDAGPAPAAGSVPAQPLLGRHDTARKRKAVRGSLFRVSPLTAAVLLHEISSSPTPSPRTASSSLPPRAHRSGCNALRRSR